MRGGDCDKLDIFPPIKYDPKIQNSLKTKREEKKLIIIPNAKEGHADPNPAPNCSMITLFAVI